jgi:hypothetical protein
MHRFLLFLLFVPLLASAAQGTPGETTAALWRALSNEPGASADVATLKRLFHPDAVILGVHYKNSVAAMRRTMIDDFLQSQEAVSGQGFYECEVSREVTVYDRFAVVRSVVESRKDKAAMQPTLVGINSIQLYKAGAEWKIMSLYYEVEKQGEPIHLGGGKAGQCLS